jgi:Golgi to ER traffic protein 4
LRLIVFALDMASIKVLEKRLHRGVDDSDYYVAEQACRTLYHRLLQAGEGDRAREVVSSTATKLLTARQVQAGTALALLLVKHLTDAGEPVSAHKALVASLCDACASPDDTDEARREQLRLVKAAIKWSASPSIPGSMQHGDPAFNARAAKVALSLDDFATSQAFFVRSDAPVEFAAMLHEWATVSGVPFERGLLISRAILLYLNSDNMADANVLRTEFARLSGFGSNNVATPVLANFAELLLKACMLGERAQILFKRLRSVYGPALAADNELDHMLDEIAMRYFNVQPPQASGMAGMMQSMMRGMMTNG